MVPFPKTLIHQRSKRKPKSLASLPITFRKEARCLSLLGLAPSISSALHGEADTNGAVDELEHWKEGRFRVDEHE